MFRGDDPQKEWFGWFWRLVRSLGEARVEGKVVGALES